MLGHLGTKLWSEKKLIQHLSNSGDTFQFDQNVHDVPAVLVSSLPFYTCSHLHIWTCFLTGQEAVTL